MSELYQKLIRTHFRTTLGYSSAGMEVDKSADNIYLNANENPYVHEDVLGYNRYPEPQPKLLRQKLANLYGANSEQLLITRGADEGIAVLLRLFCEPYQDSILINPPTFGVYKAYGYSLPLKNVVSVPLLQCNGDFSLDVEGIKSQLDVASNSIKLIFLTNPNNPTGCSFRQEDICDVLEASSGKAMVVLDETYIEFIEEESFVSKLKAYENLIILRTLSKSYALAGARVGCILHQSPDLIHMIQSKVMEAYPIPRPCVDAALTVLDDENLPLARKNIQNLIETRKALEIELGKLEGVEYIYPSVSNFMLIRLKNAREFCNYAAEHNIIIRDFSKSDYTKDCLRISVGMPQECDKILEVFRDFLNE